MTESLTQTDVQDDLIALERTAERRQPELLWSEPSGESRSFRVENRALLGAAPHADISIRDPAISRFHVELELRVDGLWLKDLGSRNGTYLDNVRVTNARFDEGLRLRVGSTILGIQYDRQPSQVKLWPVDNYGPLLGQSAKMRELFVRIAQAARSDATVLVFGETGTGKELVAAAIHETSDRVDSPLAIADMGSIHPTLLESELFGHASGAFTGALGDRAGVVETADGGTVFLDEIGELPLMLQPKLLRLLEQKSFSRVGESRRRTVDVRFIAATNRDLRTMVNEGTFREDLYFRLAVLHLVIPPLRERFEDLPLLVKNFLPETASPPSPEVIAELKRRPWFGNVRELRNFVDRSLVFGPEDALSFVSMNDGATELPKVAIDQPYKVIRDRWITHLESEYLRGLLEAHRGNVSAVAEAAGLARSYVHTLLQKHGLSTKG